MRKLPLGIDKFRKLRQENFYYLDKSMLIAEFLETGAQVTLVTRPRRFGKTLNMDMVKEFFEIGAESARLFEGLAIMNTKWKAEMNTRPVLFFSFRDCKGEKDTLIYLMKQELLREYQRFQFAARDLDEIDGTHYRRVLDCLLLEETDTIPISNAIAFLSKLVSRHYGKSVLILIDEYDTPMTSAYTEGCYQKLRSFFTALYGSALKGNDYLDMALLTGIQRVAKETIFSGLNNLYVCTVNSESYSEYFGFSPKETETILKEYGLSLDRQVKEMYDGYRFGSREIYNPWSILSYAKEKELIPYWANTSDNGLIRQLLEKATPEFFTQFDRLILDGEVSVTANIITTFFELEEEATLWGLLLNSGYITVKAFLDILTGFCTVRIPNQEVVQEFKTIVAAYTRLGASLLSQMFGSLIILKDISQFTQIYKRIVLTATSYYDAKENAYHMLMLGMSVYLSDRYEIFSNLETGKGRCDILLKARVPGYPHIIMEFKQGVNLSALSEEALEQMKVQQYFAGLSGEILLMGIAHDKKDCEIQTETILI